MMDLWLFSESKLRTKFDTISILFFIIGTKHGYNKATKQNQKIKNSSTGIQVGGDFYAGSTISKSE